MPCEKACLGCPSAATREEIVEAARQEGLVGDAARLACSILELGECTDGPQVWNGQDCDGFATSSVSCADPNMGIAQSVYGYTKLAVERTAAAEAL
jgi:hypothetical protein